MMPRHHMIAGSTLSWSPPSVKLRTAEVTTDTGWCSAKPCSHSGIVLIGTKIELAKTKGNTQTKLAACALSGSLAIKPIQILTQLIEKLNNSTSERPITPLTQPSPNSKPIVSPTIVRTITTPRFLNISAKALPATTANRLIGKDLNRLIIPAFRSSAIATVA